MATVEMTNHLFRFFPQLENQAIDVAPGSVAEALNQVNKIAPGFTDYILDDQGSLRRHVIICINNTPIVDKRNLTDNIQANDTLYIFQALTGG